MTVGRSCMAHSSTKRPYRSNQAMAFGSKQAAFVAASTPPAEQHAPEDIGVAARALLTLAEALKQPKDLMASLDKSAAAHKAAAAAAVAEQAKAAKAATEVEAAQAAHAAKVKPDEADHDKRVAAREAELSAREKRAKELLASAEAHEARAKEAADSWE